MYVRTFREVNPSYSVVVYVACRTDVPLAHRATGVARVAAAAVQHVHHGHTEVDP